MKKEVFPAKRNVLEPKTSEAGLYPILAYDVETDSDGNFTYAHVYGERFRRTSKGLFIETVDVGSHSQEELQRAIAGERAYKRFLEGKRYDKNNPVPCILVAYNYRYDFPYILPLVDDMKTLWGPGGFITGRLKTGAKMIDLTNHTQKRSLEEIIRVMGLNEKGIQKHDLEIDPNRRDVRCRDDARATYELGKALQDFYYNRWGAELAPTIAGQAMMIFRTAYLPHTFIRKGEETKLNTLERKAYYGGRSECFRRGIYEVHSYDVKSMYPSVMKDNLMPDPTSARYIKVGTHYRHTFDSDMIGIYHVRVFVPKQVIGLLPYRTKDGKLIFPYGIFEGWYFNEELQAAQQYGAKILHCYEFIVYQKKLDLFSEYIDDMFQSRQEHPPGTLYNMMYKLLMNSLYGKFGQKNPVGTYTGKMEDYVGALPEGTKLNVPSHTVFDEECINIPASAYEEAYGAFPCIAAYITALARVKLLHKLMEHKDSVVYCDTDSIKYQTWDGLDEDGHELGDWEYESTKTQCFVRPKTYWDVNMRTIKAKGIKTGGYPPIIADRLPTEEEDKRLVDHVDKNGKRVRVPLERITVITTDEEGVHARFYKPIGIKEGITRKLPVNKWVRVEKTLQWGDTKRIWQESVQVDKTGRAITNSESFPPCVMEPYNHEFILWLSRISHRSRRAQNTASGQTGRTAPLPDYNLSL